MALLWEEYCRKCHEAGETPYMSMQFGDKYRRWARVTKATMRIQHKPGDAMQVDWAGDTLPVFWRRDTAADSGQLQDSHYG